MESKIRGVMKDHELELGPNPGPTPGLDHWRYAKDEEGIGWLIIDRKGASANTLSEGVLTELDLVLGLIEKDQPKGLVIRSSKPSGFIAGADVSEFAGAKDEAAVEQRISRAHQVVDRLEALPFVTVTVAHGFCLGGGLEVALACKRRIAVEGASFGFPEVMLGLHPGLGGTARLPRLISPLTAMTMMLTGRPLDARRAKGAGLVDAVTEERHVRNAVRAAVAGELKAAKPSMMIPLLDNSFARRLLAGRMRAEARKTADPAHYPAPYALIDLWEKHGGDRAAMLKGEIKSFAHLIVSETAQNLIRVFFLRDRLKKIAGEKQDIGRIHVIGAGAMGGDIAAWCAREGIAATVSDMKPEPIAGAIKRAADLYSKVLKKSIDQRDALDRLIPDLKSAGVGGADIVIEAVPEKLDIKHKVYAAIEPEMKAGAILATNTSSIPLEQLRDGLKKPERLVGLHFFNPVSRMLTVEVVGHDRADQAALATARAFVGQIDRLPVPVKSAPGFLVNRALTPYMIEAMVMIDEGVAKETIDRAAEKFGMPMGPIELADQVGLDICLDVADMLKKSLPREQPDAPQWLRDKVANKELGRKTGKGFYEWKDGKAQKSGNGAEPTPEMTDRLILPILDVCVGALREGIVDDADVVDGAMIFGTGFAPFRGGPLHYAERRGVDDIVATLQKFAQKYGKRFAPDPGWDRLKSRA
ncbi:MAG TPA: 3-hydroxyacyl-CoA dehydrogenase NAD-binding domain-containing protein [Xanthobacteraceae bacterium]|nr:3-hydroxyacyl-CoA dehydrogenase NAD-binding domain-containing protein [Xanthobacteraceae bacterium]